MKGDQTRRNSSGGLEEFVRKRGRYVVRSATEYFRAGENARGTEGQCNCMYQSSKRRVNIQDCGNYRGINTRALLRLERTMNLLCH